MDHYTAIVSIMFLAFFEVIAICYSYGKNHHLALADLILVLFTVCILFVISMYVC